MAGEVLTARQRRRKAHGGGTGDLRTGRANAGSEAALARYQHRMSIPSPNTASAIIALQVLQVQSSRALDESKGPSECVCECWRMHPGGEGACVTTLLEMPFGAQR